MDLGKKKNGRPRKYLKTGRPTRYNPEIAQEICSRLANGESLRSICKAEHMPERITVLGWAVQPNHPFFNQYANARDIQADSMADDIVDIADDGTNDFYVGKEARPIVDAEHINRSRLRVDARKWIASKLKPKKYADKIQNEIYGKVSLESLILGSNTDSPDEDND